MGWVLLGQARIFWRASSKAGYVYRDNELATYIHNCAFFHKLRERIDFYLGVWQ